MSLPGACLPPTSSLPPVRAISTTPEARITAALRNLQSIYCPFRLPVAVESLRKIRSPVSTTPALADSGYASHDEVVDALNSEAALAELRADPFERNYAVRWLTALIARAEEIPFEYEDDRIRVIEDAAFILSSFSDSCEDSAEQALTRDFSFATVLDAPEPTSINVQLNDVPLTGKDHTDVGLQSWGASIILSGLMCADPARFELENASTVIELGAGTGLVGLTLAKLLPHLTRNETTIIATDYHPAVLDNLRANVSTNFPSQSTPPVQTALLDWSAPLLEPPLDIPAQILVAADVVYAPEHAVWLRDCAAQLLAPTGVFWLIATVRKSGKFERIADTVEAAFVEANCPKREDGRIFAILEKEDVEKQRGIGRGDESGYLLFKIGWK
ncbi:putative methyltransferase-domain-containing protein [Dendryphion nanum]|uniref:Methyltransferase-domain-containing protein n=1 Tax=Dendryphion nanum TaxID=256645 RepID=A0A9P9DPH5_9PLEO|nr:putative methyltransferase-domain-containing protein [Dendryphion nanum]